MSNLTWWLMAAGVLVVSDGLLLWFGYLYFRRARNDHPGLDRSRLRDDFMSLRKAMDGLDDCIATVDGAVRRAIPVVGAPAKDEGASRQTYLIAHRLACKGAGVAELMLDCGLSRGEAQLIHNLNAGPRALQAS
jgi:hypothetical protein